MCPNEGTTAPLLPVMAVIHLLYGTLVTSNCKFVLFPVPGECCKEWSTGRVTPILSGSVIFPGAISGAGSGHCSTLPKSQTVASGFSMKGGIRPSQPHIMACTSYSQMDWPLQYCCYLLPTPTTLHRCVPWMSGKSNTGQHAGHHNGGQLIQEDYIAHLDLSAQNCVSSNKQKKRRRSHWNSIVSCTE